MSLPIDYRNSVVLFSGGMDSTVALFYRLDRARREGGQVHVLTLSYGQRHSNEVRYARMLIDRVKVSEYDHVLGKFWVHRVHMPMFPGSMLGGDPVTKYDTEEHAETYGFLDAAFVPYRNLLFLTIAAQFAYNEGAGTISTGLRGGFPDCTAEFEHWVEQILHRAVPDYPLRLDSPTHRTRKETLVMASQLPGCMEAMQYTLTCFEGITPPCGHCLPCLKRAEGFRLVGFDDPILRDRYGGHGTFEDPDDPV